jgi:hypothetical protein
MTTLRAGIIVGSGSASLKLFDLVNKLPVMIPQMAKYAMPTNCYYRCFTILSKALFNPATYNQSFDIEDQIF